MTNEDAIAPTANARKVFSVGQITLATFLGAPIAGSLLLAWNYRVFQKAGAAFQSIVYGLVSTIILLVIAFLLPEKFPNSVLPIAYCLAMRQLVSYLQGDAIAGHLAVGGDKGSWAVTVVVGIGCLVVLFALVFGLLLLYSIFY
jgi:hypothetical protein